ncbi:MAG: outer membrane beta-barrel protein [Bacteroidales bacterium]|nr:outer membrane beta-barrel protein [Bacteroidales bacterium]
MKKKIIFILFVLMQTIVLAQEKKSGLNISFKGGITIANMYGSGVESKTFLNGDTPADFYANNPASSKFKNGTNFGVLIDYRIGKYFSIGFGANYIQKGTRINTVGHWNSDLQIYETVTGKVNWIQNYRTFDIPITFYLPFKQNDVFIKVGVFKGKLLNSEEKGKIEIQGKKYSYINERGANDKESGFLLGCGYIHSLPKRFGNIFIDFEWSRSILNSYGRDLIPNPNYYYNQTISVSVGYRYYFVL